MKILHTADWHLGKKISDKSMTDNQRLALDELESICERERPDAVIVAGDVFDTAVPSSEAEEMFFESAVKLARGRILVAIAGNHDDPDRLTAARVLAKKHNIFLVGDLDNSFYDGENVTSGKGWLKIRLESGLLNLALLPYPLESMLDGGDEDYSAKVVRLAEEGGRCFSSDGANVFVTHVFSMGGSTETMLGGARLLPESVFPSNAHYCAVGHVHKPMKICSGREVYYSGSLVPCSFEETEQRSVNMVEINGNDVNVRKIMLNNYKKLIRIKVNNYDEALEKLQSCNDYAEILYDSLEPIGAIQMGALRSQPSFVKFTPCAERGERERTVREHMSDDRLFSEFYKRKRGKEPSAEAVELFMKAVRGEEIL